MKTQDISLIKKFEGLVLKAYKDPVGIWTIGYGTIRYPNGEKVKQGDSITKQQAEDYLRSDVVKFEKEITKLVKKSLTQNQFDALVSFTYNLGSTNLSKSTLLEKINKDPDDPSIRLEFIKWNKAGGKELLGLTRRRIEESDLYFKY